MENIVLRYVFDKKNMADNKNKTGLLQVEARERKTNRCVYISTGIKLYKHLFSSMNGFTCKNHESAIPVTRKAREIFHRIEEFTLSGRCKQLSDVKDWDKEESKACSFTGFMKQELSLRNPSMATIEHHNGLYAVLKNLEK